MVEKKKETNRQNYSRQRRYKKNSIQGVLAGWNLKRILMGLVLGFFIVILPMYMFSAEPYDTEQGDAIQTQVEGDGEKVEQVDGVHTSEENTAENSISEQGLSDENSEKESFKPNMPIADNKNLESEKLKTEANEMTDEEKEKLLYINPDDVDTKSNEPKPEKIKTKANEMTDEEKEKLLYVNPDDVATTNTTTGKNDLASKKLRAEAIELLDADNKGQALDKIKEQESKVPDERKKEKILSRKEAVEILTDDKSLPATAAGDIKIRQDKQNIEDAKINKKDEKALSYDELSAAIKAERQANFSAKDEETFVDIENNESDEELDNISSLDKKKSNENKKLTVPALTNSSKVGKKKISPDVNSNNNIKNKIEYDDKNKPSAKVLGKNSISRAMLTTGLHDKEPIDKVEFPVIVNNKVMTKFYYFTEILNMEGEVLYHYWMWEGKIEFEKEIKIWGNRWRASTLKMIPFSKTGKWQARIVNEEGDVLNEIQFDVVSK